MRKIKEIVWYFQLNKRRNLQEFWEEQVRTDRTMDYLVQVSSGSNTGSIIDDPYWTSRKNSLELMELSSKNIVKFSLGFFL